MAVPPPTAACGDCGDAWPLVLRPTQSDAALPEGEPGHAPLPGAGRKGDARAPICLLPQPPR